MPRHVRRTSARRFALSTHAPCATPSDRYLDGAGRRPKPDERRRKGGTTLLLALERDGGQRRTDRLVWLGEWTEAVALGVQLLLDEAQHLLGDAGREQVRAEVRRA